MSLVAVEALYDQAQRGLAEGDAGYWKAAEAMAQLAEAGQSYRQIAEKLKLSKSTVERYLQVWNAVPVRGQPQLSFTEALGQIRDYGKEWENRKDPIPKAPEKRAELAAELIKDKAVYEQPVVREQVKRHSERQLRQAAAEWNRDHGIPTRTEAARDKRRISVVVNRIFWRDLLWALQGAAKLLGEAIGELERTGLPAEHAGAVIKAAKSIEGAAERFRKMATARAVGEPLKQPNVS